MAKAKETPAQQPVEEQVSEVQEQQPEVTIGDMYRKVVLPDGTVREDY